MKSLLALLALSAAVLVTPAYAACDTTVYGKYATAYQYQVLPVMGSEKPILEGGTTVSCGNWWFDFWGAKDIFGHQTFGNEVDITAAYDTSFATNLGTFTLEAYASYGVVPDFKRTKDDIVELYADVGRPFSFRGVTVTPYVRVIPLIGLGVYPNRLIIRSGARFAVPLTDRLSFSADVATTSLVWEDPSTNLAHEERVTKRFVPAFRYDAGDGWSFSVDGKFADRLKPEFEIGFAKKL